MAREAEGRGRGETGMKEDSSRVQTGPWRGFWIQQQYQVSGGRREELQQTCSGSAGQRGHKSSGGARGLVLNQV